jgi:nitroimidazol reductase NimA-like FMN-containing flavoprotein (pyridoxamine 5'-phosphate oxidase superfamily)
MGAEIELVAMRRKERARDADWIAAFLAHSEIGTMAYGDSTQPYLVTRNYVYDKFAHAIYMHGARIGRTFEYALGAPRVCFSASQSGRLLPGPRAVNLGTEFSSVVLYGRLQVVDDPGEASHALQLLCEKYFPHLKYGEDYEPVADDNLKLTAVLRIDIDSWSGKQLEAAQNFPGAFYFKKLSGKFEE